jgi:hypothetical protein
MHNTHGAIADFYERQASASGGKIRQVEQQVPSLRSLCLARFTPVVVQSLTKGVANAEKNFLEEVQEVAFDAEDAAGTPAAKRRREADQTVSSSQGALAMPDASHSSDSSDDEVTQLLHQGAKTMRRDRQKKE